MDSSVILKQYLSGALSNELAYSTLEENVNKNIYPESAKARCCLSFIERYKQYEASGVTQEELLLCLRDLILFTGKVQVTEQISRLVGIRGKHFDLILEADNWVTAVMRLPGWLQDHSFVEEVYAFKCDNVITDENSVADEILKLKTVYRQYKSFEQKSVVYSAINLPLGNTLLVSLTTGGGKSLITQLLTAIDDGLTLVVVPTVALAIDQNDAAISSLVGEIKDHVYCYSGDQNESDYKRIINALQGKTARLLFTSPEAILRNPTLFKVLKECAKDKYLHNLVVDEAHIVPDWGTFFRPDFQILSFVLREWRSLSGNEIRTYLLSATLSDEVVTTLFRLFGEEGRFSEFRCDSLRKEPKFCFVPAKTHNEQDEKLIELVHALPKPMVVYVLEPDEAKRIQALLRSISLKNIPVFSGKTKDSERDTILKNWKANKYDIVIATSAFGIGVDKPNVRTIIHKCVPENLSRFYQEVGRAGRDGMPSLSVLLPYVGRSDGEGDLSRAFGLVNKRVLRVESIVARWFSMLNSDRSDLFGDVAILDTATAPTTFTEQEVEYAGDRNVAWNVNLLLFLYRTGFIDVQEVLYSNETRSYHFVVKLTQLDTLRDHSKFQDSLKHIRQKELDAQLESYYLMRDLVQKPDRHCWGAIFKVLYPLAKERCNGCPTNKEPYAATESRYKIRVKPNIIPSPAQGQSELIRYMGQYSRFIIRNPAKDEYFIKNIELAADKMCDAGVGCLVIPESLIGRVFYKGMLLTYDEFRCLAEYCPFLFATGVMSVYSSDLVTNDTIFQWNETLEKYGFRRIYYCDDNMYIQSKHRNITSFIDCYVKDALNL
jgi:ATP-dependent DNA helicase RecQ